ncbi:MAG: MucR family transcriptional regulator [Magnetococcales bacterium]|nr:MucR family transcriptional regulator [Magnetococcales bacterium]
MQGLGFLGLVSVLGYIVTRMVLDRQNDPGSKPGSSAPFAPSGVQPAASVSVASPPVIVPKPEPVAAVLAPVVVVEPAVVMVPDPIPVAPEPAPIVATVAEPEPVAVAPEPAPVAPEAVAVAPESAPVAPEPAPVALEPVPVASEPAPVVPEPVPVAPEPAPVLSSVPAVPVDRIVTDQGIVCLICGQTFKGLKTHISRTHKLSVEAYRERFGLDEQTPLSLPVVASAGKRTGKTPASSAP